MVNYIELSKLYEVPLTRSEVTLDFFSLINGNEMKGVDICRERNEPFSQKRKEKSFHQSVEGSW